MAGFEHHPGETELDISHLKVKGVRTREQLNALEAENIRKATVKYFKAARLEHRRAPFTLTWIRKLHRQMFGDVWTWGGRFRTENLNLGEDWRQVETCLETMLGNLRAWDDSGMPQLKQAVLLHHRAAQIHPFNNGNGRWSRMVANIWLRLHREAIVNWPDQAIRSESVIRTGYLNAMRQADLGDILPLLELHRQYTEVPLSWMHGQASILSSPEGTPRGSRPVNEQVVEVHLPPKEVKPEQP